MGVAEVHVRSWQAAYRTLLSDAYLDQFRPEDRAQKYNFTNLDPMQPSTLVADESGIILGFATTAAGSGELAALHVDPDSWGCGIGKALVGAARGRLFDLGFRSAILWVLAGNRRAERFYQADGWAPDGQRRSAVVWGVTVDEIRYQRSLEDDSLYLQHLDTPGR